jgi:hypothetical protein
LYVQPSAAAATLCCWVQLWGRRPNMLQLTIAVRLQRIERV